MSRSPESRYHFAGEGSQSSERGAAGVAFMTKLGVIAAGCSFAAAGLGVMNNARSQDVFGARTPVEVSGGRAVVKSVYTIPPNTCFGGTETGVEAIQAKMGINRTVLGVELPTSELDWWSETLSGQVDSVVCVTDIEGAHTRTRLYDPNTNIVTIILTEQALELRHNVNPVGRLYASDFGPASVWEAGLDTMVKGVSNANIGNVDSRESLLGGLADLRAFEIVSGKCAPEVWNIIKPLLERAIAQQEVDEAARQGVERSIDDVKVVLPDAITYVPHQYSDAIEDIIKQLKENGLNGEVTFPEVRTDSATTTTQDTATCEAAPNLAYFESSTETQEATP